MEKNLLMFSGTECPHCARMRPLLIKLESETGIMVEERDTWKKQSDFRLLENYQDATGDDECRGIPFFYNVTNKTFLCGEVNYKQLKDWATGKNIK